MADENMRPTCELRVVQTAPPTIGMPRAVLPIYPGQLQQKWISDDGMRHEWRAVPFVSGGVDAS